MPNLSPRFTGALPFDPTAYIPRYWINVGIITLTILTVIGNVVTRMGTAEALGMSVIMWNWLVIAATCLTAISAAFNPSIAARPTALRLQAERELHEAKLNAEGGTSREPVITPTPPIPPAPSTGMSSKITDGPGNLDPVDRPRPTSPS